MADGPIQYETKTVTTVRGTEARSRTKWEKDRWELVAQRDLPLLRSELTFRRVKAKPPWLLVGGAVGLLIVLGIIIAVMSVITSGDDDTAQPTSPSSAIADAPSATEPSTEPPDPYAYEGPLYEIVVVDADQSAAKLNQYWVYTSELDTSSDAYRDQIKMIITDLAHTEETDQFFAEIVTNREIALAESPSTYEQFIDEHGTDYAVNTIPQLEVAGWVASYSSGYDYDTGGASDSAWEVLWWPSESSEREVWRPDLVE